MMKIYLYTLLIFTVVSCKDYEVKVSNPKDFSVSGGYEVAPGNGSNELLVDFLDGSALYAETFVTGTEYVQTIMASSMIEVYSETEGLAEYGGKSITDMKCKNVKDWVSAKVLIQAK